MFGLRALLIQIGIKQQPLETMNAECLRALLIQIGIKRHYCCICYSAGLRALLILYVSNNLQM